MSRPACPQDKTTCVREASETSTQRAFAEGYIQVVFVESLRPDFCLMRCSAELIYRRVQPSPRFSDAVTEIPPAPLDCADAAPAPPCRIAF